MEDMECFYVSRGHPSRREANWERRVSSVSDSVALDTVTTAPPQPAWLSNGGQPAWLSDDGQPAWLSDDSVALDTVTTAPPQPAWLSDGGRRAMLSRQDAISSCSSNTDSTPRLLSPADGCGSPPLLLSPGVAASQALSPLWTGSGLPPPPSWTPRSPGLRPVSTVQRSVSSASTGRKPEYAGWSYDRCPAASRHTANSQPSVSTQRHVFRPRVQRPGDWIMHHARIKPKTRPHQLPGLTGDYVPTNSDNSLSSSDSDGRSRIKSRDRQVPVTIATVECKQQSQFLSVDSADEIRISDSYPHLRIAASPPVCHEPSGPAEDSSVLMQSLSVPTSSVRRRSVSLGRTSSAFSQTVDDDDAQ